MNWEWHVFSIWRTDKTDAYRTHPEQHSSNAMAPLIETPMTASFLADPKFRNWLMSRIPLGQINNGERRA